MNSLALIEQFRITLHWCYECLALLDTYENKEEAYYLLAITFPVFVPARKRKEGDSNISLNEECPNLRGTCIKRAKNNHSINAGKGECPLGIIRIFVGICLSTILT